MFGGILVIIEELKVKSIIISKQVEDSDNYQKFKEITKRKKLKVKTVKKGDRIQIEKDIYFDILWPNNKNMLKDNPLNNNSIVCKLNYKNFSMLFTGDIEKEAEKQIIKNNSNLKSDILKVAHHRFRNFYNRRIFKSSIS